MASKTYRKLDIIDASDVPEWQRREPKWDELVQDVLSLEPGQSLPVLFDSNKAAQRARNAVRDRANAILRKPVIRTRLIKREDGKVELFLIRTKQVVELED